MGTNCFRICVQIQSEMLNDLGTDRIQYNKSGPQNEGPWTLVYSDILNICKNLNGYVSPNAEEEN